MFQSQEARATLALPSNASGTVGRDSVEPFWCQDHSPGSPRHVHPIQKMMRQRRRSTRCPNPNALQLRQQLIYRSPGLTGVFAGLPGVNRPPRRTAAAVHQRARYNAPINEPLPRLIKTPLTPGRATKRGPTRGYDEATTTVVVERRAFACMGA